MREQDKVTQDARLACWIINYTSQVLKKGKHIRVTDLVRLPNKNRKPELTGDEAKKMMDDAFTKHKEKFWTKIPAIPK